MASERRAEPRWSFCDPVQYRSTSTTGDGELANVSENGVFVLAATCPHVEETVEIVLSGSQHQMTLVGTVRWVGQRDDGSRGFGAALVDPPQEYTALVQSLEMGEDHRPDCPRRVAPRVEVSIPVGVQLGTRCDEGTLCDLSLSGGRLERTRIQPTEGNEVLLCFALEGQPGFEVAPRVVRQTESGGYAVRFEHVDAALAQALDRAASRYWARI